MDRILRRACNARGWSRFSSPRITTRPREGVSSCVNGSVRSRCSRRRILAPAARSLPTPRKSIQPKPPPIVWSAGVPSGPLIPSVTRRFSQGGWPMKKPWKRPPSVPPTPLLPLNPFPTDSSSSP